MTALRLIKTVQTDGIYIPLEQLRPFDNMRVEIIVLPLDTHEVDTDSLAILESLKGTAEGMYGDGDKYIKELRDEW
jgi:hypothetical protein